MVKVFSCFYGDQTDNPFQLYFLPTNYLHNFGSVVYVQYVRVHSDHVSYGGPATDVLIAISVDILTNTRPSID